MKTKRFLAILMVVIISISLFAMPTSAAEVEEPHTHIEVYFEDETLSEEFKEKAKKTNCYIKKKSLYLPQFNTFTTPLFKNEYKDNISYFELTKNFLENEAAILEYTTSVDGITFLEDIQINGGTFTAYKEIIYNI